MIIGVWACRWRFEGSIEAFVCCGMGWESCLLIWLERAMEAICENDCQVDEPQNAWLIFDDRSVASLAVVSVFTASRYCL